MLLDGGSKAGMFWDIWWHENEEWISCWQQVATNGTVSVKTCFCWLQSWKPLVVCNIPTSCRHINSMLMHFCCQGLLNNLRAHQPTSSPATASTADCASGLFGSSNHSALGLTEQQDAKDQPNIASNLLAMASNLQTFNLQYMSGLSKHPGPSGC